MGIARSTFYDRPDAGADDATVVAQMKAICDEFETYGYRRVGAELRHRGMVVNAKRVRRLMREYALNPKRRRRFIATTDSDHNCPICPNLANGMTLTGPNQLWVADITLCRHHGQLRVLGRHSRCLVPPGHRLRHQPFDRCSPSCCCAQGRHQRPQSAIGVRASF